MSECKKFPNNTIGGFHWYRVGDDISEKEIPLIKASTIPVRCIDTGEVFASSNEAAKAKNYSHPLRIVEICDGMNAKAALCSWEWVEKEEGNEPVRISSPHRHVSA